MIGFATRDLTDRIVEPFVTRSGGKWHNKTAQVGKSKKTHWATFNRDEWLNDKTPAAVWGCLRGTEDIVKDCKKNNIPYYFFDHAYLFKARDHNPDKDLKTKYYRITKSAESYNKLIDWQSDNELKTRVNDILNRKNVKYKLDFYKNNNNNKNIILLPPTESICKLYGYESTGEWAKMKSNEIRKYTDRTIVTKRKEDKHTPLQALFDQAYCVVSSQTTAVLDSLLLGIPSFCEDISFAKPVSKTDISEIQNPLKPTRDILENWIGSLLSCQFSLEEIYNGKALELIDRTQ